MYEVNLLVPVAIGIALGFLCWLPLVIVLALLALIVVFLDYKFGIRYLFTGIKIDENSTQHGGDLVADVLKAHNVQYIFTLVGGHISPILVGAEKLGIKVIDTRHEVTAVFAADAVARLTGTVGVAAVTAGPGLTNTITAVKNSQMAESPLLIIGGAAATLLKGRGALQDIDQIALFKSLCKFTASVSKVRDIVPTLRKALSIAQSDTPGPVFVEFPIDVLYPFSTVKREFGAKKETKTIMQRIVQFYMDQHLRNLFGDAFQPTDTSPLPIRVPKPSKNQVAVCAELIRQAKRPLILVGSQATLPPIPANVVGEKLKTLGIPCYLGGMSRGILGRNSPIQMRQDRKDALKEADLVILAGTVCDFRLGYGRVLNRKSKIVCVNRNKQQLYKNSDMFWKPSLAVQADIGSFITELANTLQQGTPYVCDKEWIQTLQQRDTAKEQQTLKMAEDKVDKHLNPIKVLTTLEEVLDENTILVADGGDFVGSAAYILRPRGPLAWLDPGAFGTLGVGGGFALGAKICRPEMDVVIIYGDGSAGYSVIEYDTFRRFKLPILSVIGNDACWTQINREQYPMFKSSIACELEYSDYHLVAEALGAKGYLLQASDATQLNKIFSEAIKELRSGKSVLINALIGKTAFREGSLSV